MRRLLLIIWQLPQWLLGRLLIPVLEGKFYDQLGWVKIYKTGYLLGVSLGPIVILYPSGQKAIRHEWGHSRQSLLLGPLYLPLVGLPSLVMNILTRLRVLPYETYYERWPESWADELGGVRR